jgi:hypothetical protein
MECSILFFLNGIKQIESNYHKEVFSPCIASDNCDKMCDEHQTEKSIKGF